jgi:hypothetical protein
MAGGIHYQVTGDGHQGIGHSGVGISANGCRLRVSGSRAPTHRIPGQLANYSMNQLTPHHSDLPVSAIRCRVQVFR